MNLIINDETKNKILELIHKYPGAFRNYDENHIRMLNRNVISKEMVITALENLMYNCQCMRTTIKSHTIYDSTFALADNVYLSIPKSSDYDEDSGIFYEDIPEFKIMNNDALLSTLSEAFKVQDIFTNVLKTQSYTSRAESILQSIESIQNQTIELTEFEKDNLNNLYVDIKKELKNKNINLQNINKSISSFNDTATNIWNRYLDNERCFLVHNYSRGHIENFIPSKYLSTSLISDKFMALFQENYNNNYGFIVKPKKMISAYYKDTFTHNRSENVGIDMFSTGKVPPILFPWEIEDMAIKNAFNKNKELLNYDQGYVLPEIVLEDYELVGVYYRTNGEGKLSPSYEAALELAKSKGLELKEVDISSARMELGLEPMTNKMKRNFFVNIIRKSYVQERNAKIYFGKESLLNELEDEKIISQYLDKMYSSYINLRQSNNLNEETLSKAINSTISLKDKLNLKDFYQEYIKNHNYLLNKTKDKPRGLTENRNSQIDNDNFLNQKQSLSHKNNTENSKITQRESFNKRSLSELKIVQLIRRKNQAIAQQKQQSINNEATLVKTKNRSSLSSKGNIDVVILFFIIVSSLGIMFVIIYSILK